MERMISQTDMQILSPEEIEQLDMRAIANVLLDSTVNLSKRTNDELLEPISDWLDDPDFMKKHAIILEDQVDWADYKRRQREWTKQEKMLAAERLRLYWQEIHRKKNLRKELSKLLGHSRLSMDNDEEPKLSISPNFLSPILSPFSPVEQRRAEILQEFEQITQVSISDKIPWKAILSSEIKSLTNIQDLHTYYPENPKTDIAAKLQHLLQMEMDGNLTLLQTEPFGEISIAPTGIEPEGTITITDQEGESFDFDWNELSDNQRSKVIADIKNNEIICRCA
jgi:hypothetical protein